MAFLNTGMDGTFQLLIILLSFQLYAQDRSFLFNSGTNSFKSWDLLQRNKNKKELSPINSTLTTVVLDTKKAEEYILYSSLIDLQPAWKLTYQAVFTPHIKRSCSTCFSVGVQYLTTQASRGNALPFQLYTNATLKEERLVDVHPVVGNEIQFKYAYFGITVDARLLREEYGISEVVVSSFTVSYINCPAAVRGLAHYPNSPGARTVADVVCTKGRCVANSETSSPYGELVRKCYYDGNAQFEADCWCKAGYESTDNQTCTGCSDGFFKAEKANSLCKKCGKRTEVIDRRRCQCMTGAYRLANQTDNNLADCYFFPSAVSAQATSTNTSVRLSWKPPHSLGSLKQIFYQVTCLMPSSQFCDIEPKINSDLYISSTGLLSHTEYTFRICSHNDVSLSYSLNKAVQCSNLKVTTQPGLPTTVRGLRLLSFEEEIASVSWQRPLSTGSDSIVYRLSCNDVSARIENERFKALKVRDRDGLIECQIIPVSRHGSGPKITKIFDVKDQLQPNLGLIMSALFGGIAFILLVAVILICIRREKFKRKAVKEERDGYLNKLQTQQHVERSLRELLLARQRNIYVPLDAAMSFESQNDEPFYEEIPPKGYEYDYSLLAVKERLGEGNFAIVHKAVAIDICGHNGYSSVAVKRLKANPSGNDEEDFHLELEIMQEIKYHPNVLRLLGLCQSPQCMIVEYVAGGDLLSFLLKSRKYRSESTAAEGTFLSSQHLLGFAREIASGMKHIASLNIVHRDLAARNVLVGYQRSCKISDFGLARRLDDNGYYQREKEAVLPVKWMARESIKLGRSSQKSDVWSFGILLWEILTIGGVPYPEYKSRDVPGLLEKGYRMYKPEHCSDEIYEIVQLCWEENDVDRPSFADLEKILEALDTDSNYVNVDSFDDAAYLPLDNSDEFLQITSLQG